MSASPGIVESPPVAGHRLRATLVRTGDRFSHRLELVRDGGEPLLLAASIDGDGRADWPPSPPLQQVHFEPRPPVGDVALLVGMAGRSHWSLSIEPVAERAGLRFDAACRIDRTPDSLGHAWTLSETLGAARGDVRRAAWSLNDGVFELSVEPVDDRQATTELHVEHGRCAVRVVPAPARFPATIRWRFTWTFTRS